MNEEEEKRLNEGNIEVLNIINSVLGFTSYGMMMNTICMMNMNMNLYDEYTQIRTYTDVQKFLIS